MPGNIYHLQGVGSISNEDDESLYPLEFLHTLHPSGMPPYLLQLKKNSPIILVRNLDPFNGACNGTRLIVNDCTSHVIDATIVNGPRSGNRIFAPRTNLTPPNDIKFLFNFNRLQFPVRLALAMTISKFQSQPLHRVCIFLPDTVFLHIGNYMQFCQEQPKQHIHLYL